MFNEINVAKAPCYTFFCYFRAVFGTFFYKAVMHFHFTCTEKKKKKNSRKVAILKSEGIKCKHNATKKQMKKLFPY